MSDYCVTGKFCWWKDIDLGANGDYDILPFFFNCINVTNKMKAYNAIRHRLSEIKKVNYDNIYFYEFTFTLHENFFADSEHYQINEIISLK